MRNSTSARGLRQMLNPADGSFSMRLPPLLRSTISLRRPFDRGRNRSDKNAVLASAFFQCCGRADGTSWYHVLDERSQIVCLVLLPGSQFKPPDWPDNERSRRAKEKLSSCAPAAVRTMTLSGVYSTLGPSREGIVACRAPHRALDAWLSGPRGAMPDLEACERVCPVSTASAMASPRRHCQGARVVEHDGRITGYATDFGFFAHAACETSRDLMALIAAASAFVGPGILVPLRNAPLLQWCLSHRLRIVQLMTLMTRGLYSEPAGAYLPSVLYNANYEACIDDFVLNTAVSPYKPAMAIRRDDREDIRIRFRQRFAILDDGP